MKYLVQKPNNFNKRLPAFWIIWTALRLHFLIRFLDTHFSKESLKPFVFSKYFFFHLGLILIVVGKVEGGQNLLERGGTCHSLESLSKLFADGLGHSSGTRYDIGPGWNVWAANLFQGRNIGKIGIPLIRVINDEHAKQPLFDIGYMLARSGYEVQVFAQKEGVGLGPAFCGNMFDGESFTLCQ